MRVIARQVEELMREIVGLVLGAAAGAAGALFVTSAEGKALIERLREEARPEVERATTEWEPVLQEVSRAVRLAAREVETATADLRARIAELAAAPPDVSSSTLATPGEVPPEAPADVLPAGGERTAAAPESAPTPVADGDPDPSSPTA